MMMKDDETSRLRAAFTAPAPPTGSCPEPDRIWEAVHGNLPPEEVREIVDHVAVCASCAEDWRIAVEFEKKSAVPARRLQPWIAAAAAALVLTVSGTYVHQMQKPDLTAEYRGEETRIESRTPASLPRQSFVLQWSPVPDAEAYDLLITTAELETVADPKGLTTTRYQVPASALADLPAAAQLHWRCTAVFPDGGRKQSPTFTTALE